MFILKSGSNLGSVLQWWEQDSPATAAAAVKSVSEPYSHPVLPFSVFTLARFTTCINVSSF